MSKFIQWGPKMKKVLFFLVVAALVCPRAFSETKTIVREAKGRGVSRDEAIRNALYEAVSQAKGVKVDSGEYTLGYQAASAGVDREGTRRGVDFDAVSVRTGGTLRRTESEGLVKTYEVLDEKKIDENTYEVTLKVWVLDYEGADKTDRVKLAVMPD